MGDDGIFRRPAVPQPVRIRRDVSNLPGDDRTLFWYERAIRAMKARALDDPLGWRYQAAIHDYPQNVSSPAERRRRSFTWDPLAQDTDALPSDGEMRTFWRQCQHNSWFFIPWHRMYLHFFEKIVARHVAEQEGPSNWALPYWNYSTSPEAARLPVPFRSGPNNSNINSALFVPQRNPRANSGDLFLNGNGTQPTNPDTNLSCLADPVFSLAAGRTFGFGGPPVLRHPAGGDEGLLEQVPHDNVHGALGGGAFPDWRTNLTRTPPGFMSLFSTAPLDPMFWLHHCNIDRLWEVWVQRQKTLGTIPRNPVAQKAPQDPSWREVRFDFHDETGKAVRMAVSEVLDSRIAPFSYEYEDTSDPTGSTP